MSKKNSGGELKVGERIAASESRGGDSFNRRTLLKRAGQVGAISLLPIGTVAGKSGSQATMLDTSFDPNDQNEVEKFVFDSFEVNNVLRQQIAKRGPTTQVTNTAQLDWAMQRKREQVLEELDRRQLQVIGEILEGAELVTDSDTSLSTPSMNAIEAQARGRWRFHRFRSRINAKFRIPVLNRRFDAFRFTHIVEWEANHRWPPKVRAIEPSARGRGKNHLLAYWQYRGATRDDVVVRRRGNYFLSEKTGKFKGCLLLGTSFTCSRNDRAYIEIAGSSNGSGRAVEKRLNGR